ncbi:hypothetical protein STTU_5187 [Streptomyces sp. Tu6071]|nr:hypothetical protein STTU_5187 [Streptomyces sp. Tu6071]
MPFRSRPVKAPSFTASALAAAVKNPVLVVATRRRGRSGQGR